MPGRYTEDVRNSREDAMRTIIAAHPDWSAAKANTEFKKQFKTMMRNKRFYVLRQQVLTAINGKPAVTDGRIVEAQRPSRENRAQTESKSMYLVEGDAQELSAAKRVIENLQRQGLPVTVVSDGGAYLVLRKS